MSVGQPLTPRRLHLSYMWEGCVKIAEKQQLRKDDIRWYACIVLPYGHTHNAVFSTTQSDGMD